MYDTGHASTNGSIAWNAGDARLEGRLIDQRLGLTNMDYYSV